MVYLKLSIACTILIIIFSCSKKEPEVKNINKISQELEMTIAYNEGYEKLKINETYTAAQKFLEAELLFPQSSWAPKSALMAAYSYYVQDYYGDAILELERFIKLYSNYKNIDYAYYLLGVSYYEQIVDEKKDLESIVNAKSTFNILINNFPNTEYSLDSEFKLDLINDILAAKEMYIGRYYIDKKKWISAINRFRTVVDQYSTTIYIEEALHRLVETYYLIGLKNEAEKYAKLLGYNFQSSEWYEVTYSLFDDKYVQNRKRKLEKC